MCVIQPCANPTEVGVWWRDDTKWCRYEAANERLIRTSLKQNLKSIDLGSIKSAVHPQGWRYSAHLQKMEQAAVSTGQRRPIMIIDALGADPLQLTAPRTPVVATPPQGKVAPRVYYTDGLGRLHQYNQSVAKALLEAVVGGKQTHLLLQDDERHECLWFDLQSMKQRVVASMDDETDEVIFSDEHPVDFFIEVPWSPTALAAVAKTAGKDMRRKIFQMVIDRYRSDKHLDTVLPAKAHPRMVVSKRMNDAVMPGHRTYERFLDCLEDVIGNSRDAFESLLKSTDLTLPSDRDASIVKLAFKPFWRDQD